MNWLKKPAKSTNLVKICPQKKYLYAYLFSPCSSVLMKGITWSRDSHGLFDYESRHLTKKTLKSSYEAMIMRSGNDLMLVPYRDN